MAVQIQFRRDTAAAWTAANPVLAAGELGLETDTTYYKIGDGTTAWTSLAYGSVQGVISNNTITAAMIQSNAVTTAKILDENVTTGKLANAAVTATKLANTAVTAGSYVQAMITVDAQGRLTSASSGHEDDQIILSTQVFG